MQLPAALLLLALKMSFLIREAIAATSASTPRRVTGSLLHRPGQSQSSSSIVRPHAKGGHKYGWQADLAAGNRTVGEILRELTDVKKTVLANPDRSEEKLQRHAEKKRAESDRKRAEKKYQAELDRASAERTEAEVQRRTAEMERIMKEKEDRWKERCELENARPAWRVAELDEKDSDAIKTLHQRQQELAAEPERDSRRSRRHREREEVQMKLQEAISQKNEIARICSTLEAEIRNVRQQTGNPRGETGSALTQEFQDLDREDGEKTRLAQQLKQESAHVEREMSAAELTAEGEERPAREATLARELRERRKREQEETQRDRIAAEARQRNEFQTVLATPQVVSIDPPVKRSVCCRRSSGRGRCSGPARHSGWRKYFPRSPFSCCTRRSCFAKARQREEATAARQQAAEDAASAKPLCCRRCSSRRRCSGPARHSGWRTYFPRSPFSGNAWWPWAAKKS
ncbi:unnamed protein product [Amoebophrya sp. A120]|nr:unnamed protein product [Amoebophrya sp. A120]|eukprot:GSA120T00025525001.1